MRPLKVILRALALTCFGLSKLLSVWPWVALIICILSPISLHINVSRLTGYECDYIGTRGVVSKTGVGSCALVEVIDTRTGEALSW
mgnify:CR=1 FL=1